MPYKTIMVRCGCKDSLGAAATLGLPRNLITARRPEVRDVGEFDTAWHRLAERKSSTRICPVCGDDIRISLTTPGFAGGMMRNLRALELVRGKLADSHVAASAHVGVSGAWEWIQTNLEVCKRCRGEGLVVLDQGGHSPATCETCSGLGYVEPLASASNVSGGLAADDDPTDADA